MSEENVKIIHDLILAQSTEIANQGKTLAAIEQSQKDLIYRLFGNGQPGTLQYLASADEKIRVDVGLLKTNVDGINAQRMGDRRWLKGAMWVILGEVSFVGFFFKYLYDKIAPVVHAAAALAKQ